MHGKPRETNRQEEAYGAKAVVWPSAAHLSHSRRAQLSRMTNTSLQRWATGALNPIITHGIDKHWPCSPVISMSK